MRSLGDLPEPALPAPALPDLPTPALLIEVDRLERNIGRMARRCAAAGVALRPHVKTTKCLPVVRRQLAAGAVGVTCATAAEVAWLRDEGVADILWAHQPVGPARVDLVVSTIRGAGGPGYAAAPPACRTRGPTAGLTVALDSTAAAEPLARAAHRAGVTVPYLIEVDTGHGRAGVPPAAAPALARELAGLPGLRLRGIMTHEGHLHRYAGAADRERAGREVGERMVDLAARLRAGGYDAGTVSVGSTPGATSAALVPGVTEARPGTYACYDTMHLRLGTAILADCAQSVLTRVTSVRGDGTVIVDAGIKAMSSDAIAALGSLGTVCDLGLAPLPGVTFADGNEEHGFLTGAGTARLTVGDLLRVVPNHACGASNMFSHAVAVRRGVPEETWPISARH